MRRRGERYTARVHRLAGKYDWLGTFDTEEEAWSAIAAALAGLPEPVPNPHLRADELAALLAHAKQVPAPPKGSLGERALHKLRAVNRSRQPA